MKKIIAILLLLTICCVFFAGCKKGKEPTGDTTHTLPPTEVEATVLEWAEILSDTALNDTNGTALLYGADFEMFALSESDNEIVIKVTDTAKNILCSKAASYDTILVINGLETSYITIDPATFNGELRFGKDKDVTELYEIANIMRGL